MISHPLGVVGEGVETLLREREETETEEIVRNMVAGGITGHGETMLEEAVEAMTGEGNDSTAMDVSERRLNQK